MRVQILAVAAALGLTLAYSPARAATFDFSFSNTVGNVSGTVSGTIYGLADSGTSAATDIMVTSAPAGVGFASYPVNIFDLGWFLAVNSFTVTGGQITAASFLDISGHGARVPQLELNYGDNQLNNINGQVGVVNENGFSGITFTPVSPSVPEPASLAVLAAGLAGLAGVRWRRAAV